LRAKLVGLRGAQYTSLDKGGAKAWDWVAAQSHLVLLALAEDGDRLVLWVVQRHAGRSDDVAVC